MRNILLSVFLILAGFSFNTVFSQPPDPNSIPIGTGNKNLAENSIKTRSIELERIKREADRSAIVRREDGVELNFSTIKKDFEGIQKQQTSIVEAYTKGKTINYRKIRKSAGKITEMGIRLNSNLFPTDKNKVSKEKESVEKIEVGAKPKTVRNLIIGLDNAIGSFVTSKMFENLKVVDPFVSEKTQKELAKIVKLSNALWLKAKRMRSGK